MSKNRLENEKSPYLKQHKDNPIWWYAWGDDAFAAAKKQDKPIFLSIGYATCHWCHVMEGDSFTKDEIAKILNDKFICIKVDREERPDVDSIYMSAVQAMTGQGGWPLSLFLTSDAKPFWGATFLERQRFATILNEISRVWNSPEKNQLLSGSDEISQYLAKMHQAGKPESALSNDILKTFYGQMLANFDAQEGGFGGAPKFPSAMPIMTLFRIHKRTNDPKALQMSLKTLDAMMRGGINDHLAGGFHRYATDRYWLVPHFEKMLYDNALLCLALLEAYQISGKDDYAQAVKLTLGYVMNQMQNKQGGFYSAEDADSEKAEGKFYVWHEAELKKILSAEEFELVRNLYGVQPHGNFSVNSHVSALEKAAGLEEVKDANILFLKPGESLPDRTKEPLKAALRKMFEVREKRIRPLLDHKILTSWNGLMIAAMAKAYQVLDDERYLESAVNAAKFIEKNLLRNGLLLRRYCDGEARFPAYLEDYAFFISGLIELYQASLDRHWQDLAFKLQETQNRLFWDEKSSGYFDTDGKDQTLIIRTKEFSDNATPSGNSCAALNLLKLANFKNDLEYQKKASALLGAQAENLGKYPRAFPFALQALDYALDSNKTIVISGKTNNSTTKEALRQLRGKHFLPNKLIIGKAEEEDGKTIIYVCEQGQCKLPTSNITEALKLASANNAYTV